MILEVLAALAPAASPGELGGGELVELAKLLGAGGAGTFALLAWQQLRAERQARSRDLEVRSSRQQELDARLERLATTLARVDERTAFLVAGEPASRRGRARTPAAGVPIAGPSSPRKPTSGE